MTSSTDTARAWVDIDLAALVANAGTVASAAGVPLLPMVKANGYGLGAVAVARALESVNPWGYGVATLEEGLELRAAGLSRPILVATPLAATVPLDPLLAADLRPSIGDLDALQAWTARTDRPFHLEIDTGMGRAGLRWDDPAALDAAAAQLRRAHGWEAAYTHFHSAETDPASVACQWERFTAALGRLPHRPGLVHAANSAAALRGRPYAADLVRPGIFLYGGEAGGPTPRPVAALRARVVAVRRVAGGDTVSYGAAWSAARSTVIATLAIGYADGLHRAARVAGRPERLVELGGRLVPIVGRVTMDMTMVDAGEQGAAVGDVATIFGGAVSLETQARAAGTIAYELLTSLGARLPRRYAGAS